MSLLEIRNLTVKSPSEKILDSVSISAEKKKITGIIGRSGSGKTTVFRSVLGLLEKELAVSGEFIFEGKSFVPGKEKRIQPVFQDPVRYFNPVLNLRQILLEPLEISQRAASFDSEFSRFSEVFRFSRSDLSKKITVFSGGELQRISIIRALFFYPELLLMDEPVSGFDRLLIRDTAELIRKLRDDFGMSILIVSHDMEFLLSIAEHIYVIEKGRVEDRGSREEILLSKKEATLELLRYVL
ncbi:MAG TPA: ATP-binding cassette domain-containing protein [Leptospiraceae bacterium]|nr:ATP-binding cassette domain-containing protein [Leptospiraceae bacterium]HNF14026.1 ATP-binding cassette domain-containing protein [Leptospiraceae bacterium]HNF26358.1 ATP-binding cassette domain-containing protein [Leptospiraceae bacterium]HNM04404.1 ATP-binding cassette domain-containing protein [Leptospiraceae bacterium]HNN02581.1 ATP-binding cassette domain-containing protein [Leptospiraceae bacterium]